MKTRILIILIILVGLGAGGIFAYKNILQPEPEKEFKGEVIEEKSEEKEENGEGKKCTDDEICPQFSENVDCESKHFKMAFVLVAQNANDVTPERLNKLSVIKNEFSKAFAEATRNLASMDTSDDIAVILAQDINIFEKFYETHDDIYDFISIYYAPLPNLPAAIQGHSPAVQNIKGIGLPLSDYSKHYWTKGKLKGQNIMGSIDMYRMDGSATYGLLHETGHQWCCYVGDNFARGEGGAKLEIIWQNIHFYAGLHTPNEEEEPMGAVHWAPNNDGTYKQYGGKPGTGRPPVNPPPPANPSPQFLPMSSISISNNDNTNEYEVTDRVSYKKYHPFVLYFMGLLPKEEYDVKFQIFDAGGIDGMWNLERAIPYKEISVRDIIEVAGERACVK